MWWKKIFININIFDIFWNSYHSGQSYLFTICILGIAFNRKGKLAKYLFKFKKEYSYEWYRPKYELEILFFKII